MKAKLYYKVIKDCLECPNSEFKNDFELCCSISYKNYINGKIGFYYDIAEVKEFGILTPIPTWCPLEDCEIKNEEN